MGSVNKVILVGHLGSDPEMSFFGSRARATFSLATNEYWTDSKTEQRREKTEWHRCVAWGRVAENVGQYLGKGRQVYLEGKVHSRSWDKDDGTKGYITEIVAQSVVFLGHRPQMEGPPDPGPDPWPDDPSSDVPF